MKKIIYSILTLGVFATVATSCNLDMEPTMGRMEEDSFNYEYNQGLRSGVYSTMKGFLSGGNITTPDLYVDVVTPTDGATSTGQGRPVYSWRLFATSGEVLGLWNSFFGGVYNANYALWHMQETLDREANGTQNLLTDSEEARLRNYMGEMYFFRAWMMYRASLIFCAQPATTPEGREAQDGLPYPTVADPDLKLNRGNLHQLYENIEADLRRAEATITEANGFKVGEQNAIYLTMDAVKAFRAQLALHLGDYTAAAQYANDLITSGRYPLVNDRRDLERMWREDISTETIFHLDVLRTTMGTAGAYADYVQATYEKEENLFLCSPLFIPEFQKVKLFRDLNGDGKVNADDSNLTITDIRYGLYMSASAGTNPNGMEGLNNIPYRLSYDGGAITSNIGYMINKFLGNVNFQINSTQFTYRGKPKMFRIAEMYMIAAEAQFRLGGDVLTPLNALREARGLAALVSGSGEVTGMVQKLDDDGNLVNTDEPKLFRVVKEERTRELLGEGTRLYDLKRWDDAFTREVEDAMVSSGVVDEAAMALWRIRAGQSKPSEENRYVWPIPNSEIQRNENIGNQNPGWGGL